MITGIRGPISESPAVRARITMDFPTAIKAVIDGDRITRLEWGDEDTYGRLRDGFLMIHLEDGWHTWTVNDGDLVAQDWVKV